jgi:class 3 adenylate cyclase
MGPRRFRSVVEAVRCAIELQHGMIECNAGVPAQRRIEFRVGINLGDVVEEADGGSAAAQVGASSDRLVITR